MGAPSRTIVLFAAAVVAVCAAGAVRAGSSLKAPPAALPDVNPARPPKKKHRDYELEHDCIHDEIHLQVKRHTVPVDYGEHLEERTYGLRTDIGMRQGTGSIRLRIDNARLQDGADAGYTCYPADVSAGRSVTTSGGLQACNSDLSLSAGKRRHLEALMDAAKLELESILDVVRIPGVYSVPGYVTDCYTNTAVTPLPVPQEYKNGSLTGIDMVMIVTTRPIASESTLAFASNCVDDSNRRPIMGFVNFNPEKLRDLSSGEEPDEDFDWGKELGTAIHEIAHALGFSGGKMLQFRNQYNNDSLPADEIIEEDDVDGKTVRTLITPAIRDAARLQFNCPTLKGVEIEDGGEGGTAGSHWEKRQMNGEFMIGTASRTATISNLTLAFLHDSGWYFPKFERAKPQIWGAGLDGTDGCAFASARAHSCVQSAWDGYKCSDEEERACSPDRMGKAGCSIKTYTTALPSWFAHFAGSPTKGGGDALLDYCPVLKTFGDGWCTDPGNAGSVSSEVLDQGERFCEFCRCFDSSLTVASPTGTGEKFNTCYETYCTEPGERGLKIRLDGIWYPCDAGDTISIDQWGGELECPTNGQLCKDAQVDADWPKIYSIDPEEGGPGTKIEIKGDNFVFGMEVRIDKDCTDVQVEDRQTLRCTIADSSEFIEPKYLVPTAYDVILFSPDGTRHAVLYDSFTFGIGIGTDAFAAIINYIAENPGMGALIIGGCIVACGLCLLFIWNERRNALKGDKKDEYNWQ